MKVIFNDSDLISAFSQKRKAFWTFMIVLFAYVILCVSFLVYYTSLPFEDPGQALPKWIIWVSSCVFVIFSHVFLTIKYHRISRYYKMIAFFSIGKKQVNNSIFLRQDVSEYRYGVDYEVLIFSEWSKKKQEYMDKGWKIVGNNKNICT